VKCLIWDFDGTLAHHRRGLWSGSMLHCLKQAAPGLPVSREDLRRHPRTGFPWHAPELAHPDLDTPQKWWDALFPVLERAYVAAGVAPGLARELPARVREDFVDPAQWRVFPDVFPALDGLSPRGDGPTSCSPTTSPSSPA
jgi:putative hydrolase of the HAD superfamily